MRLLFFLLFSAVQAFEPFHAWFNDRPQSNQYEGNIVFKGEKHLQNIKQLTFGGANAEAYFSFDNKKITFQASGGPYGTDCDQIYEMDLTLEPGRQTPRRISNGIGATTCSFFLSDNKHRIYAGTFLGNQPSKEWNPSSCPMKQCDKNNPKLKTDDELAKLCNRTDLYIWNVFPDYDIFLANEYGNIVKQLTNSSGYDAEGVLSPDGKQILFTSKRDGDLNLYLMDTDGQNVQKLTNELGYDGGAFFSPDGKKIVWRASRPQTQAEKDLYNSLLKYDMVQPIAMELYYMELATKKAKQITKLGGANWAPYYLNDNKRIIFSSDFNETANFGAFSLYVINEDGTGLEQVTYAKGFFDSFPMMSYDGKKLIWGSSRNSSKYDINLYIADWTDNEYNGSERKTMSVFLFFALLLILQ